jgi:RNA polymerase sigma factor (sigma-70 family)
MVKINLSDQELVNRYINGDEIALEKLIYRHKDKVYSFILSKVKDVELAEDFFQDTFIKVIKTLKLGNYNEEGKFLPWVMRIAHNLVIDYFRKNNRFKKVNPKGKNDEDLDIFDTIASDYKNYLENDESINNKILVKKLIDLLPDEQKEVIKLRHYYDMSFKEIAEYSNVSINTALGRMRYAVINLRKYHEQYHL